MSFSAAYPFSLPELPPDIRCSQERFIPWLLKARTELGELKGYSHGLPNPMLFLSPAIIRESVASSGIENINTTVEKVLEQQLFPETEQRVENKEVLRYRDAILWGFDKMRNIPLGNRLILGIHKELLGERSHGYRSTQNRIENSSTGEVLYTPPATEIGKLIGNWENYIHEENGTDPLIKCAIAHYQFEAIHPFGDGNGRVGRILMVLYLVEAGLLNYPILFISAYINKNRNDYYKLLREVTTHENWCEFIEYLLRGFYMQARDTKDQLFKVMDLFNACKEGIKAKCANIYSADLVEQLFAMPIVTPVRLGSMLNVHYTTATRYLKQLEKEKFLQNQQVGKYQLYINKPLVELLQG
ncbi:MAG: Fic family protein [Bacteroidota bacterium]